MIRKEAVVPIARLRKGIESRFRPTKKVGSSPMNEISEDIRVNEPYLSIEERAAGLWGMVKSARDLVLKEPATTPRGGRHTLTRNGIVAVADKEGVFAGEQITLELLQSARDEEGRMVQVRSFLGQMNNNEGTQARVEVRFGELRYGHELVYSTSPSKETAPLLDEVTPDEHTIMFTQLRQFLEEGPQEK